MSRELLHRVLTVLEDKRLRMDEHLIPIIVEDIKEELTKPEPYMCHWVEKGKGNCERNKRMGFADDYGNPSKEWVGLTDEEKTEIFMQAEFNDLTERQMYDVVEAKLKEKNT